MVGIFAGYWQYVLLHNFVNLGDVLSLIIRDLRQQLRDATKAEHHKIDHHLLMENLLRGDLNKKGYITVLNALYCLHFPIENAFLAIRHHGEFPSPMRSGWLAEDLDRMGGVAGGRMWSGRIPETVSGYVGMRYVIEGSAMGGKLILRHLATRLPVECRDATRFFQGDSLDLGWKNLWEMTEQVSVVSSEAIDAAKRLFDEIDVLFTHHAENARMERVKDQF